MQVKANSKILDFSPHTALCNLHSGVTIFDCEEKSLESIAEKMVSEMVSKKEMRPKDKDGVLKSLLQNPRYPPTQQPAGQRQRAHVCNLEAKIGDLRWSLLISGHSEFN